jgi:hypothetical protein
VNIFGKSKIKKLYLNSKKKKKLKKKKFGIAEPTPRGCSVTPKIAWG